MILPRSLVPTTSQRPSDTPNICHECECRTNQSCPAPRLHPRTQRVFQTGHRGIKHLDDRLDDRLVSCRVVFGGLEGKRRGSCRRSRDCFLSVGSRGEAIRSAATADVRTSDVRRQDCQHGQRAGVRRPSPTRRWNGAMLLNQLDASEFAFNVCSADVDVDVGAGADVEMLRSCSCRSAVVMGCAWSLRYPEQIAST